MFRNKFLSIVAVLCILSTLFFGVNVLANYRENNSRNDFFNNQDKSLELHEKILTEYKEDHLDYFGGFFLDDEGFLNINLVEDNEQKAEKNNQLNVKELVKGDNVKFRHVKYSLAELHNTTNVISNEMLTLGIKAVELDEINNAVVVYLESLSKEVEVKSKLKNKLDFSPVIFKEMPSNVDLQFTYKVNVINGESATYDTKASTIGYGAKCNSTDKHGFLLAGHCSYSVGDKLYYNGDHFATVTKKHLGGSVDAAFAERVTNTWFWQPTYRTTNSLQGIDVVGGYTISSSYPVNTVVNCYGAVSGKESGVILSNNYNATVQGVALTDMVKTSYCAQSGDSGAPVTKTMNYYWDGREILMGLHSASAVDGDGNWIPGVSFSMFSKITNITSELDVTPHALYTYQGS